MHEAMLSAVPGLRAFAISLCGNIDVADDLVQETLLRAIANIGSFQSGTNLRGWLTTILRNHYVSEFRKHRNEVEDTDGRCVGSLRSVPEQDSRMEFAEFRAALATLPCNQQEALLLVGALGLRYDEAAAICGTGVATIRSRIHRARARLAKLLAVGSADEFGPDDRTRAVLNARDDRPARETLV
jgi:RNA polymerase sigma-70 factor (ECF subfamily)